MADEASPPPRRLYHVQADRVWLLEADQVELLGSGGLAFYAYLGPAGAGQLALVWAFAPGQWTDVRPANTTEREAYEVEARRASGSDGTASS